MLTDSERSRYARHLILPEIGESGQAKLKRASVLIVGAGGLGSPVALYLTAAGVGRIGLVDFDRVDATNLQRQILYGTSSIGRSKLDAARDRLHDLNPEVAIETHELRLTPENALAILERYDVIVDGTDNFPTRYLVNDACTILGRPSVHGSIFRFDGQVSVFNTTDGPCYRCLHPEPPPAHLVPSCAEAGVLGVLPGVIGTIQATEAIKLITGAGETLAGRLLLFDALAMSFRTLRLPRRCNEHAAVTHLIDYEEFCTPVNENEIIPTELSEKIARGEDVVLIDVREPHEWNAGHLEQAQHIPLAQLPNHIDTLPRDREVIVICRSGGRSAHAQHILQSAGFARVRNLIGGMTRYSRDVDPSIKVV